MLTGIHRYTWLLNWLMGRGLKKRTDGTDRQNNVDFNIDSVIQYRRDFVCSFSYLDIDPGPH